MRSAVSNFAYIDNTNLHKGCEAEGFSLDYAKFRRYLLEKHSVEQAYIFIGYVPGNEARYTKLQEIGYTLIFKPTITDKDGKIKGNCDAELVLQAARDFYEKEYAQAIIVTSDGDFACLIQFLQEKNKLDRVLSPRRKERCSTLIRKLAPKLTFIPDIKNHIQKWNTPIPDRTDTGVFRSDIYIVSPIGRTCPELDLVSPLGYPPILPREALGTT